MEDPPEYPGNSAGPPQRRPYMPPHLTRYGDVRLLTQSGTAGNGEGSSPGNPTSCANAGAKFICTSDRRAKEDIIRVGTHPLGFGLYLFSYRAAYRHLGSARQFGVMADEVEQYVPGAVATQPDGLSAVDYGMLGIRPEIH